MDTYRSIFTFIHTLKPQQAEEYYCSVRTAVQAAAAALYMSDAEGLCLSDGEGMEELFSYQWWGGDQEDWGQGREGRDINGEERTGHS